MTRSGAAPAKARLGWVDAARGTAVLLVVLFHATNWLLDAGYAVEVWETICLFLASVRLPLFFALSGIFAQKWTRASWSTLWSGKLSLFVWVFGLWSVIATFTFMFGLSLNDAQGNYFRQFVELAYAPFRPRFELWFIWGLALYFVLAKLVRRVPAPVTLLVTGTVSAVVMSIPDAVSAGPTGAAKYVFFFFLGLHGRDLMIAFSGSRRWALVAGTLVAWAAAATGSAAFGLSESVPGYLFLTSCLGVCAGISLSRVLQRLRALQRVGAQTLPIYLTHTSVVLAVAWALHFAGSGVKGSAWVLVLPPALAALAAGVALLLSSAVKGRPVVQYLYEQPPAFARLPERVGQARRERRAGSPGSSAHADLHGR